MTVDNTTTFATDCKSAAARSASAYTITRAAFASALTLAYLIVAGFQIARHVMWFDEWQAWLLASHARTLPELFSHMRYETHPRLWHVCLFVLSRFTSDPRAMQAFHLALATAGVYLVAARSPFTRLQCVLYAFGYFVFYEYSAISRCYVLGLFFTILALLSFRKGPGRLPFYLLLAVMTQIDAFSIVIAGALAACDLARMIRLWSQGRPPQRRQVGIMLGGWSLIAAGVAVAFFQIKPAPDSNYPEALVVSPATAVGSLANAWALVPPFRIDFWNYFFFSEECPKMQGTQAIASVALLGVAACVLALPRPEASALLIVGCLGTMAGIYLSGQLTYRHAGHHFIALVAACWIADDGPAGRHAALHRGRSLFFTAILCFQLIGSGWAFACERRTDFSASRTAANFIKAHFPPDIPVVMSFDGHATSLSGYLGRPVYCVSRHAYGDYSLWDSQRKPVRDPFVVVREMQQKRHGDVLLIMRPMGFHWFASIGVFPPSDIHLQRMVVYDESIADLERYYICWCHYEPPAATTGPSPR